MPEFEKGDKIICIETHHVPGTMDKEICEGERFEIIDTDKPDSLNIHVRGLDYHNRFDWWTSSKYFKKGDNKMERFEKGDKVICLETHVVPNTCHDHGPTIYKGDVYKVIKTDYSSFDGMEIQISGMVGTWWTHSAYFKKGDDKMQETDYKVGDFVTAIETFSQDNKMIYSDKKYKVTHVFEDGVRIIIDGKDFDWWVPKSKIRLVKKDKSLDNIVVYGEALKIKKVIFNDPATIVFWNDDEKTVVKCQNGEKFDPEKGLALAISKRVLGNNYIWHGKFMKWLPKNIAEKNPDKKGENKKDE